MQKIVITLLITVAIVFTGGFFYQMSIQNTCNGYEQSIKASHKDSKNVLSRVMNSIKTNGLVANKYFDTVVKALEAGVKAAEAGGIGSQVAIMNLQNNSQNIPTDVLTKLMNIVTSSYTDFEVSQSKNIDLIRSYETFLGSSPEKFFTGDYPTIDLEKYGQLVLNKDAKKSFETGEMEAINPF